MLIGIVGKNSNNSFAKPRRIILRVYLKFHFRKKIKLKSVQSEKGLVETLLTMSTHSKLSDEAKMKKQSKVHCDHHLYPDDKINYIP
jgi:hypothetical protein